MNMPYFNLIGCFSLLSIIQIGLVAGQSYLDQSTPLYVTSPACASYKCEVVRQPGDALHINWLNAPFGDVKLVLASETNGKSYTIAERIAGTQRDCYHGDTGHRPCGQYTKIVPANWTSGKYSVQVISLSNPDKIGYTDIVTITKSRHMARNRTSLIL
ncbi:uncharacterized protein PGTG_06628 [Puccinia graminis f. sp. tritici CRL 75-36-700-3]|uniref:Secreted protein n=1 Tax=Puccinia graminis f. sp. tritici (strain CRL 75-36-700-3 / race SCCL) TaxID=418459 RepID=E3K911_PUCGT|nr:uncharacterized protein PGTG_06628 [Puccinia graminis f. sp. tritici CRL 75-36-700-3]EFP80672.1 hypothetical protein PGTG_06628 [Puccinia graminis f. sp. tritici CRL 75-36-700-3]